MDQIYKNRKNVFIWYRILFYSFKDLFHSGNFDNQCILLFRHTTGRIFYNYTCNIILFTAVNLPNMSIIFKLFLDIEIVKQSYAN